MRKLKLRIKRHNKLRQRIVGTTARPRLSVFKSGQHIYAQIIDDLKGQTLVSSSDIKNKESNKKEKAYNVGVELAKKALKKKIKEVVFDRGGFLFHGRVAELAKGAREGGLLF
ncbi:50S ribosomal protein L18 [Candidatus Daviesbacteria bacterium RIFCSPLOWO2_01_FULL_38_10]|nr:MAG: 50S ribosomal protein L18 [Candidatus Daviesbacteria bacterium GW2011_GWA2_38_17]OGE27167.1 MAG: 50S ribosomal protein L18 [Candidatus Daviesbacteria bacterium RIFCSPHIGHO2_02_FULL_39_41]OGE40222.1 MAG: 50S ribosomal protein L18 [Candidatus Daviesbacteria bacterium RIFCSPLOWO2_01_FULL_38_10]OGE45219.1 MAG: 50S ribosomal protein L18 [Candidatus Daviesbacteria bacterium RIFCSPHIGHO2_12_FULL_38_25]OGE68627.1 MAG: 50S ribosomal protein L18 [Candidatus Daviesbacteria bacterium RIFCSPLOWO2_02